MGILIFVSYATKDAEWFKIKEIAEKLVEKNEIENVLYWQEDMKDDIYKYMNDYLGKCDLVLLFCSINALDSKAVEMEWQSALKIEKKIIPIFNEEKDIPPLLTTKLGVMFKPWDLDVTIEEIYALILKKLDIKGIGGITAYEDIRAKKKDPNEIVPFWGAEIFQFEVDVLQELERMTGMQFSPVDKITWETEMGFSVENNRVTKLGLREAGLTVLPDSIGTLAALKEIYLHFNRITEFPEPLIKLEKLEILYMGDNKMNTLPESIKNLKSLVNFDLHDNFLSTLPNSIGELTNLKFLNFRDNDLETLPQTIGKLRNLEVLILKNNHFKEVPDQLTSLESLKILIFSNNLLETFQVDVQKLNNLEVLDFQQNNLKNIPESLISLESLKTININMNTSLNFSKSMQKIIKKLMKKGVIVND
ncbi:MAG: TIR domain-containing protein [Candidatus Lokiarchaeota archaeon]|nr:TIR domain-containing protein [Candidatus Lokiarchaeota archaeon]